MAISLSGVDVSLFGGPQQAATLTALTAAISTAADAAPSTIAIRRVRDTTYSSTPTVIYVNPLYAGDSFPVRRRRLSGTGAVSVDSQILLASTAAASALSASLAALPNLATLVAGGLANSTLAGAKVEAVVQPFAGSVAAAGGGAGAGAGAAPAAGGSGSTAVIAGVVGGIVAVLVVGAMVYFLRNGSDSASAAVAPAGGASKLVVFAGRKVAPAPHAPHAPLTPHPPHGPHAPHVPHMPQSPTVTPGAADGAQAHAETGAGPTASAAVAVLPAASSVAVPSAPAAALRPTDAGYPGAGTPLGSSGAPSLPMPVSLPPELVGGEAVSAADALVAQLPALRGAEREAAALGAP